MSTKSIHQRYTLQAAERLQLRKQIETLFQNGEAFSFYPVRVLYRKVPRPEKETAPVRVAFSIPKKRVRKAVIRNRYRRLLREAWRLEKFSLYSHIPETEQLHCFLIFTGQEKLTFDLARAAISRIMQKLSGVRGNVA
jgi:ribonuclease P protein component